MTIKMNFFNLESRSVSSYGKNEGGIRFCDSRVDLRSFSKD